MRLLKPIREHVLSITQIGQTRNRMFALVVITTAPLSRFVERRYLGDLDRFFR